MSGENLDFNLHEFLTQLEKIEDTNSSNLKFEHLNAMRENVILYSVAKQQYNSFINYGVTVPVPPKPALEDRKSTVDGRQMLGVYEDLCGKLQRREITGGAAKTAITSFLSGLDPWAQHWFARFFNRQVARGMGEALISKIHPEVVVSFYIQKANDFMILDAANPEKDKIAMKVDYGQTHIIEPKFDGLRGLHIWDTNRFVSHSSNGLLHNNCEIIDTELKAIGFKENVLDSELLADNWNETSSVCGTESEHPKKDSLRAYIFDCLSIEDWEKGQSSKKLSEFKRDFNKIFTNVVLTVVSPNGEILPVLLTNPGLPHLVYVKGVPVYCDADVAYYSRQFFVMGFEGGVVKNLDSYHTRWTINKKTGLKENNTTLNWLKCKFWETYDFVITNLSWSTDPTKEYNIRYNNRHPHLPGAPRLLVDGLILDIKGTATTCGTMSDAWREFYSDLAEGAIGHYCEVKFQKNNQSQFKSDSLRFPSHCRFRQDK